MEAIQRDLDVSERTLLRYVKACRDQLVDGRGRPLIETVRRGDRRLLRLAEAARSPDSTSYKALSFYFAMSVLQVLDRSVLEDGVDGLWERFRKTLPPGRRTQLADLERKFHMAPVAVRDYGAFDARLDAVLQGLINQRRLHVRHAGFADVEAGELDVEPYPLALHDGGLRLLGFSRGHQRVLHVPVECLRDVVVGGQRFEYPARYAPGKHVDGVFGIGDGEETEVSVLIRSERAVEAIRMRRLHPTQRCIRQQGGAAILSMRVRATEQVKSWILSLGPSAEVIAPSRLRDDVRRAHAEAAALYGR
jgi:predicted DNA-binding transcriptional regulator YafY